MYFSFEDFGTGSAVQWLSSLLRNTVFVGSNPSGGNIFLTLKKKKKKSILRPPFRSLDLVSLYMHYKLEK